MTVSRWSAMERSAAAPLSIGLARCLYFVLPKTEWIGEGYLCHEYVGDFEISCIALWSLGVAHAAYPDKSGITEAAAMADTAFPAVLPPFFKFFVPNEIDSALSSMIPENAVAFQDLLAAYLAVTTEYGTQPMSFKQDPFYPEKGCVREVDALLRLGYLHQCDGDIGRLDWEFPQQTDYNEVHYIERGYRERCTKSVVWTDKVTAAMTQAFVWPIDSSRNS